MYVSIVLVRVLLAETRRRGISDRHLLQGTDVDVHANEARVALSQWAQLVRRAVQLTQDPAFGIALGEQCTHGRLQLVGRLMASCTTLREAFGLFRRYSPLLTDNVRWTLEERGEQALLLCETLFEDSVATCVEFEALLAWIVRLERGFLGMKSGTAAEVWFKHAAPKHVSAYSRIFDCDVRFGQRYYAIVGPREFLDRAQLFADDVVREALTRCAETALRQKHARTIAERVRWALCFETDVRSIKGSVAAHHLGLSVRQLERRCRKEGVSLAALVDEARWGVVRRELCRPGSTIKQASYALGYSSASALHRAFRRWSGMTPSQYLRKVRRVLRTSALGGGHALVTRADSRRALKSC